MFRKILIRILLSPFALLYGLVVSVIYFSYDTGLLKASRFSVPVIGIGNLSMGGAGKTPHVEYLIELLKDYINVATLSRGYKRKTSGFRFVTHEDTALTAGDEPVQYRRKYRDILVAVAESRAYAIPAMIRQYPDIQAILLDDAFQHRSVKPGLSIMLTPYDSMFYDDYLLPAGRLREWRSGYRRADIIIVSKCPESMSGTEKEEMTRKINPLPQQQVYFTRYRYADPYDFYDNFSRISLSASVDVILLSAIANTDYLLSYLEPRVGSVIEVEYEDHHVFDKYDIDRIIRIHKEQSSKPIILTTEKDAVRLEMHKETLQQHGIRVYVLPVQVKFHFDESQKFDASIRNFLLDFEV